MTLKPAWGIAPPPEALIAWGARAIYTPLRRPVIDLVWDRISTEVDAAAFPHARERKHQLAVFARILGAWLLPRLKHEAPHVLGSREHHELVLQAHGVTLLANPQASCGYLYLGAYATGPLVRPAGRWQKPKQPKARLVLAPA